MPAAHTQSRHTSLCRGPHSLTQNAFWLLRNSALQGASSVCDGIDRCNDPSRQQALLATGLLTRPPYPETLPTRAFRVAGGNTNHYMVQQMCSFV